jgi:nucleoside phosphorylase
VSQVTTAAAASRLLADKSGVALAGHILRFDPEDPSTFAFSEPSATPPRERLAPIPWPSGLAPIVNPSPTPAADDPLPSADVLVVTWTVAESQALADVLTPGLATTQWQTYRHNFDSMFKPELRQGAPALESNCLGIYARCTIGDRNVICMKSDLHLSQDGPKLPVRALWRQIIQESGASLVISTGTAGGIGAATALGDVVVTKRARFDCQRTFRDAPFATSSFSDTNPTGATSSQFGLAQGALMGANVSQLPAGGQRPGIVASTVAAPVDVLTTDFFAFDDAEDSYGLRAYDPQARAVEMGDAVLGLVCAQDLADPPAWVLIRNASDPQIAKLASLEAEAREAAAIYEQYGYWTTVGSAITTWAVVAG